MESYWKVYSDYEILPSHEIDGIVKAEALRNIECIVPKCDMMPPEIKYNYRPLQDTPDLFLRFASLPGREVDFYCMDEGMPMGGGITPKKALSWANEYGLLGDTIFGGKYPRQLLERLTSNGLCCPLEWFRLEAIMAKRLLTLYEAVVNEDYDTLKKRIKFVHSPFAALALELFPHGDGPGTSYKSTKDTWKTVVIDGSPELVTDYMEQFTLDVEVYINLAMFFINDRINTRLKGKVSPIIRGIRHNKDDLNNPWSGTPGWSCHPLLAAMYLQFYWLITQKKPIRRCDYCGGVYELTRSNKRFCSKQCRENNWYHKNK